jgi:hypothetical protein
MLLSPADRRQPVLSSCPVCHCWPPSFRSRFSLRSSIVASNECVVSRLMICNPNMFCTFSVCHGGGARRAVLGALNENAAVRSRCLSPIMIASTHPRNQLATGRSTARSPLLRLAWRRTGRMPRRIDSSAIPEGCAAYHDAAALCTAEEAADMAAPPSGQVQCARGASALPPDV